MLKPLPICIAITCLQSVGLGAGDAEPVEAPKPLLIRLLDLEGRPVAGAHVGLSAYGGELYRSWPPADGTDWRFYLHAVADADGTVCLPGDCERMDVFCLVAFHPERRLIAIEKVADQCGRSAVSLSLQPACRVSLRLTCPELKEAGSDIGWAIVNIGEGGTRAMACATTDGMFEFFLPPGEFELWANGTKLHRLEETVTIRPGQETLELAPLVMQAKAWALLEGQPAPELEGVVAWKNSPPLKIADLRGKVVLLDFWGYWCRPCVDLMPNLFALHDEYHARGLEIISIHIDDNDLGEPVDSVEKFDRKLGRVRTELWNGRDLPFPVALVRHKPMPFDPPVASRKATCPLAAKYGIGSYPTAILIGRDGKVIGRIPAGYGSYKEELEKALSGY